MIVDYQDVSIQIEDSPILKDVSLAINACDFVFLTGKVGTGKTTLLRTLYGMTPLQGTKAQVLDFDLLHLKRKKLPYLRRQLGIIFQDFQLLPDRTVYANLEFVLKATGWKKKADIKQRIEEALQQVQMTSKADSFPHELSGGEQQRVAIARAILNNPQLIIADEPTGNLDIETSTNIVRILQTIAAKGTAVIMSTHNLFLIPHVKKARVMNCSEHGLHDVTEKYANISLNNQNP